ncbi:MAG: hypothetical protein OEZ35_09430, partial [Candidatus Bathyarchaeota archaeon]|nr:hypothetical protein [Candidatus Bathyarchaeota archaeon]
IATMANLEAAKICNHRRTIHKTWKSSLEKKKDRLKSLKNRAKEGQVKLRQKAEEREERYRERLRKLEAYRRQLADRKQQSKPIRALKRRISLQREAVMRQKQRLKELKTKHAERMEKLMQMLESRRQRDRAAIDKLKLRIVTQKETRDYNLVTSLKSYIDPRIYYEWGKQVDYDWKRYYPKALQRKFGWVETDGVSPEHG